MFGICRPFTQVRLQILSYIHEAGFVADSAVRNPFFPEQFRKRFFPCEEFLENVAGGPPKIRYNQEFFFLMKLLNFGRTGSLKHQFVTSKQGVAKTGE